MAEAIMAIPAACANCEAQLDGSFCGNCGQRAWEGRLTVRRSVARLVADAFDLDRGVLFTFLSLSRRPGHAIREYVSGRITRYTNPVKYFLVIVAVAVLVYVQTGTQAEVTGAAMAGPDADDTARQAAAKLALADAMDFYNRFMNIAMAATVPLAALVSRGIFWKAGLNFAEHLVFNLYTFAHSSLVFVLLLLGGWTVGWSTDVSVLGYSVFALAYYAWAAVPFFQARPVTGTLRAVAVQVVTYLAYLTAFAVGLVAYVVIRIL